MAVVAVGPVTQYNYARGRATGSSYLSNQKSVMAMHCSMGRATYILPYKLILIVSVVSKY